MSDLVGKKVLIEFDTNHWPIARATYTYEGSDADGYWVRRADGRQRHFPRSLVVSITPVTESVEEPPH